MVSARTFIGSGAAIAVAVGALSGCTSSSPEPSASPSGSSQANSQAVVVVSGFAAQSPFTTPTEACKSGDAAGLSDTGFRTSLLAAGYQVYTSPAQVGPGQISSFDGQGAFDDCPTALPESMTVNALDPIDEGGERLRNFVNYLNTEYGVTSVDLVAHSMGGLFSRSAIKALKDSGSSVTVRSLTTVGTPWEGSFAEDIAAGAIPESACGGEASCEETVKQVKEVSTSGQVKAPEQLSAAFLDGENGKPGWNQAQEGALTGIPVTLFAGNLLTLKDGNPQVWPNDGLAQESSALAPGVSDAVLPHRQCFVRPDVHSAFFSEALGFKKEQALTYDPVVLNQINEVLADVDTALSQPNRVGCPS